MNFTKQFLIASMLLGLLSSAYADNGGLDRSRNFYDRFKSEQERLRADKAAANQDDKNTRNPEKENNNKNRSEQ